MPLVAPPAPPVILARPLLLPLWEDDGRGWNASALAKSVLGARAAPAFDARLARGGLGLGEAAVFAATLEALVAEESAERLRTAFRFEGVEAGRASARARARARLRPRRDPGSNPHRPGIPSSTAQVDRTSAPDRPLVDSGLSTGRLQIETTDRPHSDPESTRDRSTQDRHDPGGSRERPRGSTAQRLCESRQRLGTPSRHPMVDNWSIPHRAWIGHGSTPNHLGSSARLRRPSLWCRVVTPPLRRRGRAVAPRPQESGPSSVEVAAFPRIRPSFAEP